MAELGTSFTAAQRMAHGSPRSAALWCATELGAAGLSVEIRDELPGGGAFAHGVLRARGGGGGSGATLVIAAAVPRDGGARTPGEARGALVVLALARALAARARWLAHDIAFVLYVDAGDDAGGWGRNNESRVCDKSEFLAGGYKRSEDNAVFFERKAAGLVIDTDSGVRDADFGYAGQAGCYARGSSRRGVRSSDALAAWSRAAYYDAWMPVVSERIARSWRAGDLGLWAAAVAASFSERTTLPSAPVRPTRPLRHPIGPIRAAIVVDATSSAGAAGTTWGIISHGAAGEQPDIELIAAVTRAAGGREAWATRAGGDADSAALEQNIFRAAREAAGALCTGLWGPTGAHAELMSHPAHAPALTLHAPGAPPLRLGTALERIVRALNGLDERLHAGARSYILVGPARHVPLAEFVIAYALAHVPAVAWPLAASPSSGAAVNALAAAATGLLFGAFAYLVMTHAGLASFLPRIGACVAQPADEFMSVALIVSAIDVLSTLSARATARKCVGARVDHGDGALAGAALALAAHGCATFPLLYYNAPLALVSSAIVMPALCAAAALATRTGSCRRTAARTALWVATSPAAAFACSIAMGRACDAAAALAHATDLHATYGTSHIVVLTLLWLPLRTVASV